MRVRINYSGDHHAAPEVGGFYSFGYEGFGAGTVANVDKLAVFHDHGFSPGPGVIDRVDLTICQYPIGRWCFGRLFPAAGDQ